MLAIDNAWYAYRPNVSAVYAVSATAGHHYCVIRVLFTRLFSLHVLFIKYAQRIDAVWFSLHLHALSSASFSKSQYHIVLTAKVHSLRIVGHSVWCPKMFANNYCDCHVMISMQQWQLPYILQHCITTMDASIVRIILIQFQFRSDKVQNEQQLLFRKIPFEKLLHNFSQKVSLKSKGKQEKPIFKINFNSAFKILFTLVVLL